jgi:hypothetical protein
MNLDFCVQSKFLQIYLFLLQNLVWKVAYFHYYVVLEHIVVLLVHRGLGHVSALLTPNELEIMVPFWAFSNAPPHLIFAHA